ncbi:hypothetical protein [Empedobacter brevis]|uniref:hypothetical protein n=1 Tax=Empedobacter brevis TaxID=247 RepID=UPI0039B0FE31
MLQTQIWLQQLMNNFYPQASFLNFVRDFSAFVDNDKLNMAEVGVDPKVLINNKTYPIKVVERTDNPLSIELDLYETENTLIREPEAVELAYDKLESVIYGHRQSLVLKSAMKAAHAYTPNEDSDYTPVIITTGEDNGEGFKRLMPADILKLKRRFDDLDINTEGRNLVLHPAHLEDLILYDLKSFKDITEWKEGQPSKFAGFNILQFSKMPVFDSTTLKKKEFDAEKANTDTYCSFAFSSDEVMKADGDPKMYTTLHDPKERATIVGFDKRFIALPIRNKGIGAIVTAKV